VNWEDINWNELGVSWDGTDYNKPDSSSTQTSSSIVSTTTSVTATAAATTDIKSNAASTSSAVPQASAPAVPNSKTSPDSSGLFDNLWHDLEGCSNHRGSFGGRTAESGVEVSYMSNYGVPYGSNMMFVDSADNYDYTMTFINKSPRAMSINCWNKPGSDGTANSGATDAPKSTTITFNLDPEQQAIVAVDEDTVLSCCESVDRFHSSGAFAQTWTEAKFKDHDSGYDVSKILNTGPEYKVTMSSKETPCVSSETMNNWITEEITTGSGSCYIPTYGAHLTIEMGGAI
jgi:hypothetical protein